MKIIITTKSGDSYFTNRITFADGNLLVFKDNGKLITLYTNEVEEITPEKNILMIYPKEAYMVPLSGDTPKAVRARYNMEIDLHPESDVIDRVWAISLGTITLAIVFLPKIKENGKK